MVSADIYQPIRRHAAPIRRDHCTSIILPIPINFKRFVLNLFGWCRERESSSSVGLSGMIFNNFTIHLQNFEDSLIPVHNNFECESIKDLIESNFLPPITLSI